MKQAPLIAWLFPALLLLGALFPPAAPVQAAAGPWVEKDQLRFRLISASETAAPAAAGPLQLGLQFQMQPGWKIYWRSPGDAGFPPSLDWAGSHNLAAAALAWPAPHRFSLFGLETFGYGDEVVLPITAEIAQAGEAVALKAQVELLTCEEICIPYNESLTLDLPAGSGSVAPEADLIERHLALVPGDGSAVGLTLKSAYLSGALEAPQLEVRLASADPFVAPDVMVEGPPSFTFSKPEVVLSDGGRSALLRLSSARGPLGGVVEGKRLTLTVLDAGRAMEQVVLARYAEGEAREEALSDSLATAAAASPAETSFAGLLKILGLALLGGLILNLMPCVLPVLSIKLLSVVKQGGRERGEVRLSFLASAAGIICSFLVLAAVAVALKSAGLAVGWGIQFQQPIFLTVMALLVTLFACNLFGFFEIGLPGWLGSLATSGPHKGMAGHFVTGAFATLLATPCSAPFLGTAIGFALARGAGEIFLIFAFLGVGLALPYLAIAGVPRLATAMPRPGAWMVWLRRVLGLALAGTALWLLSVLAAQMSLPLVLGVGLLLCGLGLVLWLRGRWGEPLIGTSRLVTPVLASFLALGSVLLPLAGSATAPAIQAADAWPDLDRDRIDRLVAEGNVVFVDVTADWCITCQVNKKLVLNQQPVEDRLKAPGISLMRGDWTLPSDAISDYLAGFERYGIPFNAVYGPGAPDGVALPELLTVEAVLEALEKAGGG